MSDAPQGPGWWQASDDKWYPPEQAAGYQPPAAPSMPAGFQPMGAPGMATGGGGKLDIGAALSFGWAKFTQHVGQIALLLAVMVGVMVLFMIGSLFMVAPAIDSFFVRFVAQIVIQFAGAAIMFIIGRGLIRTILAMCDGQAPDPKVLFDFANIGNYALTAVLYSLVVGVGMIFCVLPGVVAMFLLWFWPFAQVDRNLAPVDALKTSLELVKTRPLEILVFLLATSVVNSLGMLACGVGLFVTIPVTMIASGYAWRVLSGGRVVA